MGIFRIMVHCKYASDARSSFCGNSLFLDRLKYKKKTYYLGRLLLWELEHLPQAHDWLMSPEIKPEWNWFTGWLFRTLQARTTYVWCDQVALERLTLDCHFSTAVKSNLDNQLYVPLERTQSSTHLVTQVAAFAAVDEVAADPSESSVRPCLTTGTTAAQ